MDWHTFLTFLNEQDFPQEAKIALTEFCHTAALNQMLSLVLKTYVSAYENGNCPYAQANEALQHAAQQANASPYTVWLVFYILLTKELRKRYREHGIPDSIYLATMKDFKSRALFCHLMHHIWGTIKPHWFAGYFEMARFTLGRLQFEKATLPYNCTIQSVFYPKGTPSLTVHIPEGGSLSQDACMASFSQAKSFFGLERAVFSCESWLLFPEHYKFLPPQSNILRFMQLFTLVEARNDPSGGKLVRIFGPSAGLAPQQLPRDTSLRAAYADWLSSGGKTGGGTGILVL